MFYNMFYVIQNNCFTKKNASLKYQKKIILSTTQNKYNHFDTI